MGALAFFSHAAHFVPTNFLVAKCNISREVLVLEMVNFETDAEAKKAAFFVASDDFNKNVVLPKRGTHFLP